MELERPVPTPTPTSKPFWDALKEQRVSIQQCEDCHAWVFYPRSNCNRCLSPNLAWKNVSGEGTLYTFTIARQPTSPHFADEAPQKLAVVELDEGVHVTTTLVDVDEERIEVGMRVKPYFDRVSDDVTLLRYQPA